ncbi:Pentatricopeptide repeat-containing protein [Hibiscus syriacus]|uniref:Pentatricopeptide repeat-containing protein n=1 Tax=Hibiscus syriacus TaxID=106335 RepID=A0A6A2WNB4_HIBSY|nr:pentatricopeptide repeat-containing protein At5g02830, chloroplastic [Hibiscus syriacus]KAE8661061.1 Pentatricopeptide repeat-containing protein [Hibiscus syriacus]
MKDFVVILGSSSIPNSPPPPNLRHRHHSSPNKINSSFHKLSPSENQPQPISSSVPTSHSHQHPYPPLSSTVRWNPSSRRDFPLKYYADLASKLAEDGRLEDFAMTADMVVASGVNALRFASMLSVEIVSKGVALSVREGKVKNVVEVFKKVEKLGVAPLKLVNGIGLDSLKREFQRILGSGEVEEAVDLLEALRGFQFTIKELVNPSHIVKICVDKRNPNLAIRYACLLPHARIMFCSIICEFGKRRDLASALTAYELSKNMSGPNMYLYRAIIDTCGLCGDYMKSRNIYQEDLVNQRVSPNIYVFNSLMNVNAHDLGYTLDVYKDMQNLGIAADTACYNILLKACCLAHRVDLAQDIYNEVKHLESTGVLKLDAFTYCTIVKVFADARLWQKALKIKEDMISAGVTPNTVTWSSLINSCANAGLVVQAFQLFEEMILSRCEPNSQCCNVLLHACVEASQYDRAFRLFRSWMGGQEGNIDSTLKQVNNGTSVSTVSNHITNSHHHSFLKKFSFKPTTATYNILMKACCTDYYRAKAIMDEMKSLGLSPNHVSWTTLINICGGSGNVEGAVQILKTMHMTGIKPDVVAYTTAMKVCVEGKRLKLAFSLFEEMKRYRVQPNLVTYNTLLRARSKYGSLHEVQQCLAVYQEMRKAGYESNDIYLKELIEEWCEGVIKENNQKQEGLSACKRTDLERPHGLLLEKIAVHLQMSTTESPAIDIRRLTKVEARIVVLAVLRMIKENYIQGHSVKDDMLIILGVGERYEEAANVIISGVKDAVMKLLQDELGLEVLPVEPRVKKDRWVDLQAPIDANTVLLEAAENNSLSEKPLSSTRRPVILQRLKVTRKSLNRWLQRRADFIT